MLRLVRPSAIAFAIVSGIAMFPLQPVRAQLSVVHDPVNAVHFIAQIKNQLDQITRLETQITNEKTNLQNFRVKGLWTQLEQRLVNLQNQIAKAQKTNQISGGVADAQMSHMGQEMATLQKLENLANSSSGSLQAQQAQARLQAEMIAQLHEQRQLSIAQLKQAQLEQIQAMQRYHATPQDPSSY